MQLLGAHRDPLVHFLANVGFATLLESTSNEPNEESGKTGFGLCPLSVFTITRPGASGLQIRSQKAIQDSPGESLPGLSLVDRLLQREAKNNFALEIPGL